MPDVIAMRLSVLRSRGMLPFIVDPRFADTIPVTLEDDEAERYLGYRAGH